MTEGGWKAASERIRAPGSEIHFMTPRTARVKANEEEGTDGAEREAPDSVLSLPHSVLGRPGDDLLSRVLRQSTIGAEAFDGRVRDGIGSYRLAKATRPAKDGVLKQRGRRAVGRSAVGSRGNEPPTADCLLPTAELPTGRFDALARALFDNENNQVERAISTG